MTVLYAEAGYWDSGYTLELTENYVQTVGKVEAISTVRAGGYKAAYSGMLISAVSSVRSGAGAIRFNGALVGATGSTRAAIYKINLAGSRSTAATTTLASILNFKRTSATVSALSRAVTTVNYISQYPGGINLNSKSQTLAAVTVRAVASGKTEAQASVKAASRIFWENTSPASGTWTTIVPQAEGTGK